MSPTCMDRLLSLILARQPSPIPSGLRQYGLPNFIVDDHLIRRCNRCRRREVRVRNILAQHAMRVEKRSIHRDAMPPQLGPASLIRVEPSDSVFKLVIKPSRFRSLILAVFDTPAGNALRTALDPP